MRKLLIAATIVAIPQTAIAQQPLSAQAATAQAIARIQRIDPQLGSVIAIDPTAIEQARRIDASGARGPLAGSSGFVGDGRSMAP